MIDSFVRLEAHEEGGRLPALFIHVLEPCLAPGYGHVVIAELHTQWRALEETGDVEPGRWDPTAIRPTGDDARDVALALAGVHAAFAELMDYLVLVLTPSAIVDRTVWNEFVARLGWELGERPAAKLMILDDAASPTLDSVAKALGPRLHTSVAALDMPGAITGLAAAAGGLELPGGAFRAAFTGLCLAAGVGDLAAVERHAAAARTAAAATQAPYLIVAVDMARGDALLRAGRPGDAIALFRSAEVEAAAAPPELRPKLERSAKLSVGAALVSAGAFAQAVPVYQDAAVAAQRDAEPAELVDAWRMVGYCRERGEDQLGAFQAYVEAVRAGALIEPDQRPSSTLAHAGAAAIDLARDHWELRDKAEPLEVELVKLFGVRDWRPS